MLMIQSMKKDALMPLPDAWRVEAAFHGGSALLMAESGRQPGDLKDMVCSPGGTTIEGLAALEEGGMRSALIKAVERCTAKARELGKR